jgi:hypothetical protein
VPPLTDSQPKLITFPRPHGLGYRYVGPSALFFVIHSQARTYEDFSFLPSEQILDAKTPALKRKVFLDTITPAIKAGASTPFIWRISTKHANGVKPD